MQLCLMMAQLANGGYEINGSSRNGQEGNYLLIIDSCPDLNNCKYGQLRVEKDSQAVKSFTEEYMVFSKGAFSSIL